MFARTSRSLATASTRVFRSLTPVTTATVRSAAATRPAIRPQIRTMKTLNFGGTEEVVWERADFPRQRIQDIFKNDTLAVIGYGSQGIAQSLNAREHGLNVILGLRRDGPSWTKAQNDGWVPNSTLFPIEEACDKGTIIMNLLSDAGQKELWPKMKPYVTKGKTLYFSHGFGLVYGDQTGIVPPNDVDVILCAPKGSGTTVRSLFKEGKGINSSIAIHQDVSGQAKERVCALGIAVGSGYLYETTFKKEVHSDLTGERGVLMGAIYGLFKAQYEVLRSRGHTPSEAFNETVEEATQSLYPLIGEKGMDWMYANCSTTARRGALDWYPEFHKVTKPVFERLYDSVTSGEETKRALEFNSRKDYAEALQKELDAIQNEELWRAGETVRALRPERS